MFDSSSLWFYIIDALNLDFNWREVLVPKISRAAGVDLVADGTMQKAVMLLPFVPRIWLKMGEKGVVTLGLVKDLEARRKEVEAVEGAVQAIHEIRDERLTKFGIRGLQAVYYPPAEKLADGEVVSVNGAGDTFLGVLVAGLVKGRGVPESVMRAQRAAVRTLKSKESVGNVEEVWKEE